MPAREIWVSSVLMWWSGDSKQIAVIGHLILQYESQAAVMCKVGGKGEEL